ncbi:MAG: xylose isomerase, partial [Hamadaea sp.]|nr:xylose isomerase [Hamadaea sp.]
VPTLSPGETVADLMASDVDFDPDVAAARGANFIQLTQLAVEHLMGAR